MTINDLRCDVCGRYLPLPGAGVRFVYHPGVAELRDDTGLTCTECWDAMTAGLDTATAPARCAACGAPVTRRTSLHVRRADDPQSWRLCLHHTVGFLNALRTVEPKFDAGTFRFPGADAAGSAGGPGPRSRPGPG